MSVPYAFLSHFIDCDDTLAGGCAQLIGGGVGWIIVVGRGSYLELKG